MNAERYKFPPVLQPLEENTHEDDAIISEAPFDPSIDCIPSDYTIDNQLDSTENFLLIPIPTIVPSHLESSTVKYRR